MPSGSKVQANVYSWGMNMYFYLVGDGLRRTEGLCGSYDGDKTNDLKIKGTNQYFQPSGGLIPSEVVESWRSVAFVGNFILYFVYLVQLRWSEQLERAASFAI